MDSCCDLCGKPLLADEDTRYVVDIRVYAAYDPMELSAADLRRDRRAELRALIEALAKRDAKALEAEVFQRFRFDLCPPCRARYVRNPLGGGPAAARHPTTS